MVCPLYLLCQRYLAPDASDRFSAGEAVPVLEACDLGALVGGDDDGAVNSLVDFCFKKERHVVDHDSLRIFSCDFFCEPRLFASDTGVDDVFKPAQLGPVSENYGSQFTAIEGAVRIEDVRTERFHDLSPGRFARFDDLSYEQVGIDDDRAVLLEHLGDGALARGDAACEAN